MYYKSVLTSIISMAIAVTPHAFAGEVYDRIMSTKTMVVANSDNFPPLAFMNPETNQLEGFDVDVAKEIAKRLGDIKLEYVHPEWSTIVAGNWQNKWDIAINTMTPTVERAKVLDFAAIYYYTIIVLGVHRDSKALKPEDLNGKNVAVPADTTGDLYLQHKLELAQGPRFKFRIKPGSIVKMPETEALKKIINKDPSVDAFLSNISFLNEVVYEGAPIRIIERPLYHEPLSIAIDKGDKELSEAIAEIVANMHADGTLTDLSFLWFGDDFSKVKDIGIDYTKLKANTE